MTATTADDRLSRIQCLALQRWASHLARLTETHERKARSIAARAIDDIIDRTHPLSRRERESLITSLSLRLLCHLALSAVSSRDDAERILTQTPALAAELERSRDRGNL